MGAWAALLPGATLSDETKLETFLALSRANCCCPWSFKRRERSLSSRARAYDFEPEDMSIWRAIRPDTLRAFLIEICCCWRSRSLEWRSSSSMAWMLGLAGAATLPLIMSDTSLACCLAARWPSMSRSLLVRSISSKAFMLLRLMLNHMGPVPLICENNMSEKKTEDNEVGKEERKLRRGGGGI